MYRAAVAAAHITNMTARKPKHLAPRHTIRPSETISIYMLSLSVLVLSAVFVALPHHFGGPSDFTDSVMSWMSLALSGAACWGMIRRAVKEQTLFELTFLDGAGLVGAVISTAILLS